MGGLDDTCRVCHGVGFTSVNLDSYRSLFIMDSEFAGGRSHVANERVGIDELGINTIGSVALTEGTEGRIGHILHGSEIKFLHPFTFHLSPLMSDKIYDDDS